MNIYFTEEQRFYCLGTSIRVNTYLNESTFSPIRSRFPAILGFLGNFWATSTKSLHFFLLRSYLLLYSKTTFSISQLQRENLFENRLPWAEILQTKPAAYSSFSQVLQPKVGLFKPLFVLKLGYWDSFFYGFQLTEITDWHYWDSWDYLSY